MDSIVPIWVCFVVWARRIRIRVDNNETMKIVFWKFMLLDGIDF